MRRQPLRVPSSWEPTVGRSSRPRLPPDARCSFRRWTRRPRVSRWRRDRLAQTALEAGFGWVPAMPDRCGNRSCPGLPGQPGWRWSIAILHQSLPLAGAPVSRSHCRHPVYRMTLGCTAGNGAPRGCARHEGRSAAGERGGTTRRGTAGLPDVRLGISGGTSSEGVRPRGLPSPMVG